MKRAALIGAAAVALVAMGAAAPAVAHNYLTASNPVAGETLTELPAEFFVTTNDALLDLGGDGSGFGIEVIDADGLYYGDGCVTVGGSTMSTVPAIGEAGEYTFVYQFVSADGHTVSDEFAFTWAPAGEFEVAEGSATQPDCDGTLAREDAVQESTDESAEAAAVDLGPVLWIGGAAVAVIVAVGAALLLTRRRS